ncbi:HD-GYP domain-containing protein [candidate division TA06 bacterium]|uniref:HD-GYP domain-containing protein n=1 Tax=candidate division TA06 bacterium TaxID=2250710 RepID=A0A523UNZ8_UNCT6|nr:MAG: HD-GYP domain-containing protein [candidate division TA06 bacterium]
MRTLVAELDERKTIREGNVVVNRLFSLLKISRIYDPSNKTYVRHVQRMYDALDEVIQSDEGACLEIFSDALFMNGTRLKPDFSSWASFRSVMDTLESKGIGRLDFHSGVTAEELATFFSIFTKVHVYSLDPFGQIEERMIKAGICHISIDRVLEDDSEDIENTRETFSETAKKSFYYAVSYLKGVATQISLGQVVNARKSKRVIQAFVDEIVEDESYMFSLTTIKNFDEYTLNHSINVSILSLALGMRLGLSKSQLLELGVAALFHDLGKVRISGSIVNKPGRLTEEEFDEVKKHPFKGAIMLSRIRGLGVIPVRAMFVALQHHQTPDHRGYPGTDRAKELDLYSRIVSIADVFDAASSPRVYRPFCLKREEVLAVIAERSGTQFDPLLAKVFVEMLGVFPVGSLVLLDTEEFAIVWRANQEPSSALRPKVKIITDSKGNFVEPHIESLTARTEDGKGFARTIVKALDPQEYGIDVTSYL